MRDQKHSFVSRHGTLIVSPEGVTIKRNWSQALQHGHLLKRQQTIAYRDLQDIKHKQLSPEAGYLQLTTKPGTPGQTPFSRHAKLSFDAAQSHQFRQAQRLIEERLQSLRTSLVQQSSQPGQPTSDPFATKNPLHTDS